MDPALRLPDLSHRAAIVTITWIAIIKQTPTELATTNIAVNGTMRSSLNPAGEPLTHQPRNMTPASEAITVPNANTCQTTLKREGSN